MIPFRAIIAERGPIRPKSRLKGILMLATKRWADLSRRIHQKKQFEAR
jgi:hypothetical protein